MKKILSIFVLVAAIIIVASSLSSSAATGANVTGWAWSSNTGLISLSSDNPTAGGGGPHGITFNGTSGDLNGYSWSTTGLVDGKITGIGWISFNRADVTDCYNPSNNTYGFQANLSSSTGRVVGWIRAVAGKGRTDGWDGCIELSGDNHESPNGKGVTMSTSTGRFSGYAWGGPVVGWVDFSGVTCAGCKPGGPTIPISLGVSCDQVITDADSANPSHIRLTAHVTNGVAPYTYGWNTGMSTPNTSSTSPDVYVDYVTNSISHVNQVTVTDNGGSTGNATCVDRTVHETCNSGFCSNVSCTAQVVGPGGTLINVPEDGSEVQVDPGGTVTVRYTASSGFTYSNWRYGTGSGNTSSATYSEGGPYVQSATVSDGTNNKTLTCPAITKVKSTDNEIVGNTLLLKIGKKVLDLSAMGSNLTITKGTPFVLKWAVPDEYNDCQASISNNGSTYWSSWSSTDFVVNKLDHSNLQSNTSNFGQYDFTLTCEKLDPDTSAILIAPTSTKARLNIVDSSEREN